jgi:hypothetical protein
VKRLPEDMSKGNAASASYLYKKTDQTRMMDTKGNKWNTMMTFPNEMTKNPRSYMTMFMTDMRGWYGVGEDAVTIFIEIVWIHGLIHLRLHPKRTGVKPLVQSVGRNGW